MHARQLVEDGFSRTISDEFCWREELSSSREISLDICILGGAGGGEGRRGRIIQGFMSKS